MANDGFTQVPNEVLEDISISVPARLLYVILLSYAWKTNQAYPGQGKLAEKMGVSDKSVRTYLKELVQAGLLSKKRRGLNMTNLYTLNKWIFTGHKRKNVPIKKQQKSSLKNRGQLPPNNTQINKTKSESSDTLPTQFDEATESKKFNEALTDDFIDRFKSNRANRTDIVEAARRCFAWHLKEGKTPFSWTGALFYWLSKERWDD